MTQPNLVKPKRSKRINATFEVCFDNLLLLLLLLLSRLLLLLLLWTTKQGAVSHVINKNALTFITTKGLRAPNKAENEQQQQQKKNVA